MSSEDWRAGIGPKVWGSWNLHQALPTGLELFIMLSSAVCIFGKTGQANYSQKDLFAILDYYCNPTTAFASPTASQLVTGIALPALIMQSRHQIPDVMLKPLFRAMHWVMPSVQAPGEQAGKSQDITALLKQGDSFKAAGNAIADEALKVKLCKILGMGPTSKAVRDSMTLFGIDSLIALEMRNCFRKKMRTDLAVYKILCDSTLLETGLAAAKKSGLRQKRW